MHTTAAVERALRAGPMTTATARDPSTLRICLQRSQGLLDDLRTEEQGLRSVVAALGGDLAVPEPPPGPGNKAEVPLLDELSHTLDLLGASMRRIIDAREQLQGLVG